MGIKKSSKYAALKDRTQQYSGCIGDIFIGWCPAVWRWWCICEWEKVALTNALQQEEGPQCSQPLI